MGAAHLPRSLGASPTCSLGRLLACLLKCLAAWLFLKKFAATAAAVSAADTSGWLHNFIIIVIKAAPRVTDS